MGVGRRENATSLAASRHSGQRGNRRARSRNDVQRIDKLMLPKRATTEAPSTSPLVCPFKPFAFPFPLCSGPSPLSICAF